MDGLLIIDKPAGITSHDVVARVRRVLKTKRVGHTGTLDPFATGVIVVLVGKATRLAQFLDKDRKEYVAEVQFGSRTDTGDVTGKRIATSGVTDERLDEKLRETDWEKVLSAFRGDILQTPPMYSAKKVEGRKLYELAREGKEIERKAVSVTIHDLEILPTSSGSVYRMSVACSAGTYIRTLAEDIGEAIGVGAHLVTLQRTAAGEFDLDQAITLEKFAGMSDSAACLLPVERAVRGLAMIELPDDRVEKTRNGLSTRIRTSEFLEGQSIQMLDGAGSLVAIGIYDESENSVRPKVVLV